MDMKTLSLGYLGILFVSGLLGGNARLNVAKYLLSTESIDSPKRSKRWMERYLFFSFWHLLTAIVALAFMLPVLDWFIAKGAPGRSLVLLHLLLCLPLAAILFVIDLKLTRACDVRKLAAREKLRSYLKSRRERR